jgi:hypothetical protein
MRNAFLCRHAHQSIYDLLGRNPITSPLTPVESGLFFAATQKLVEIENQKPEDR